MAICDRCSRTLPPNGRCHYCGSPDFAGGETKRRKRRDAFQVFVRRLIYWAIVGLVGWWFFTNTDMGINLLQRAKGWIGK